MWPEEEYGVGGRPGWLGYGAIPEEELLKWVEEGSYTQEELMKARSCRRLLYPSASLPVVSGT